MSINRLASAGLSIGVELPLDNDWSADGVRRRDRDDRPFGVPDMSAHLELIQQANRLGFRAAWVRDVPLYDPAFGDAAQVFETFTYLGYLAGQTDNILLGTAAVVLPLRQPWLVRKAAATVQALSGDRLLLGVASGDRPSEYPLFAVDYQSRGQRFRDSVAVLKGEQDRQLGEGQAILPAAVTPPLLVAGLAQQSPAGLVSSSTAGWPIPVRRPIMSVASDFGMMSLGTSRMSALSIWICKRIHRRPSGATVSGSVPVYGA